jgi:SAM-dependent methyltransferase
MAKAAEHFAFGKNWASYAAKVTEAELAEAERGLVRLLGPAGLATQRFLDIGCGSGLHAVAALRLGAREVIAVDLDPESVRTSEEVLRRFAPEGAAWRVLAADVFDLTPGAFGTFDIVYSWGVLHHTGNLERALASAAALVGPNGRLVLALYRRTWLDAFWRVEKRWYAHASDKSQARARSVYLALFRLRMAMLGKNFAEYVRTYRSNRGMDYYHDVHDWMGGWPYETIEPGEVARLMAPYRFEAEHVPVRPAEKWFRRPVGLFGSGCEEYVYRRP